METISFDVKKRTGLGYANVLRTVLIESSESVKPIAFSIDDESSAFMPSDDILDVVNFCQKLCDLTVVASPSVEFPIQYSYSFKGKLTSKNLCNDDLDFKEDVVLLESIDSQKEVNISIIFDKGSGFRTADENRQILNHFSYSTNIFRTISCRYTDVTVATSVKEDLDTENVTLRINSKSGNEKTLVNKAIEEIVNKLQGISESF